MVLLMIIHNVGWFPTVINNEDDDDNDNGNGNDTDNANDSSGNNDEQGIYVRIMKVIDKNSDDDDEYCFDIQ